MLQNDEMIDARHAAKLLGLHINTLKRISANEIPYYRVTSRGDRRYNRQDIDAYLLRHRQTLVQEDIEAINEMIRGEITRIIEEGSIFTYDGKQMMVDKILSFLRSIGYEAR